LVVARNCKAFKNIPKRCASEGWKVTAWFQKVQHKTGATSAFKFNQDAALMMCTDLQPFSITGRDGL